MGGELAFIVQEHISLAQDFKLQKFQISTHQHDWLLTF